MSVMRRQPGKNKKSPKAPKAPKAPKPPKAHPLEVLFVHFVVSKAQKVTNILVTYLFVALSVKCECVVLFVGGV